MEELGLILNLICIYAGFAEAPVKAYLRDWRYNEHMFAESGSAAFSMPVLLLFIQMGMLTMFLGNIKR